MFVFRLIDNNLIEHYVVARNAAMALAAVVRSSRTTTSPLQPEQIKSIDRLGKLEGER